MNDLFLRSVEFSNFRIYGDSYAFEFPNGPGVTLITGGNGLGKTSFFDGVEWALTDKVGRFSDIPVDGRRNNVDPLTRIGAPDKSHRVSLQFSDGSVIDRGAGFEAHQADIVRLLKRPDWAEISDLHGYLSITHFFGQASAQRFSLKKPTDQWEALKGPAGVDRINTLRERMSGLGVKRAFTRAIEDRSAKLEQSRLELAALNELIEERDRARQLASSEHAIPPSDLRFEVERLANQVLAATGRASWMSDSGTEPPEAALDAVSALLRTATDRADSELERVEELTRLLNGLESTHSESSTLGAQVEATETKLSAVHEELKQADAKLLVAVEALRANELEASHAQSRLIGLGRVLISARQLDDAQVRQTLLQAQLSTTESAAREAAVRCEQLREQHSEAAAQRSERRALADRVALARLRSQIFGSLARLQAEIVRALKLISDRNPAELCSKRAAWAADAATANDCVIALTSELRQHDDRARAMTEAVTAIAHRLGHDDTACPVCATAFPPGQLLQLIRAQLAVGATPASSIAATLVETRLELERLHRQMAEADRDLANVAQLEALLATYRTQEGDLRQQLVEAGGTADGDYDDSGVVAVERELQLLDDTLAEAATPETLAVLVDEAEAEIRAEAAKRTSAQQLLAVASDEIQASRSVLLQHPDLWSLEVGILVDLKTEQETAEQHARDAGERVATAKFVLTIAQSTRDALQAADARESGARVAGIARLAMLSRKLQDGRQRWTDAGQAGDPDATRLAFYRQAVTEGANRLRPIRTALERLIIGYRKWLDDEQLRKLEEELVSKLKAAQVDSELECQAHLVERVEQARKDVDLAQSAKNKVEEVGSLMQQQAKIYAGEVLVPLNATINRFARALMAWSETAVSYKAEHFATRSELRPNIVRSELDGSTRQVEMNPSLYFSEGQLSALSVAALLAASTTFGWSRWRGLLLDDPMQHNDVIHASAFMDLLRQMVLGLRYQIILSTHDSAEAEFLSRKCRSAGIPYQVHELVPRGATGLVSPNVASSRVALG